MSNSLNQVALTFVQIVLNNSLTYYGALSPYGKEIPLAACGIVMKNKCDPAGSHHRNLSGLPANHRVQLRCKTV